MQYACMYDGKTGEAGRWDQRSPLFASMVYIRSLFCENMGLLSLFHRSEASKRIGCNIYSEVVACKIANIILIHGMLIWKKFQSSWVHQ